MSRLQADLRLLTLLNRVNFEDALASVQGDYVQLRSQESEERLKLMQDAMSDVFDRMNKHFEERELAAIRYLEARNEKTLDTALKYIRQAPSEIKTPVREAVNIRWPAPAPSAGQVANH
jgi:hypothetical protein